MPPSVLIKSANEVSWHPYPSEYIGSFHDKVIDEIVVCTFVGAHVRPWFMEGGLQALNIAIGLSELSPLI